EIANLFEDEGLGEFDRTLVAAAMARFGDERGAAHLVERIEADHDDRPIAAEWAGRLGVQQAADALAELADEEGDPARGAAMRARARRRGRRADVPAPLIDAHAHLDFAEYGGDLDGVLSRARTAGLVHIVVIGQWREGAGMDGALDAVKLAERDRSFFSATA